jgi:MoaA/NifB/PqqE/SkfB family radical SAM enzyme
VLSLFLKNHLSLSFIKRMAQWHLNYYLFGRGTPVSAGVYIIDSCNYKCKMCDIRLKDNPTIYPRETQERDIDALSQLGVIYYSISGGEPTLVPDLSERLTYAAKKIPYVHLVTNGSTMTKDLAKKLGNTGVREISISIDGMEEFQNAVRGVKNSFYKAWNALGLLSEHAPNVQIVVNSVLSQSNVTDLMELKKKLDQDFPKTLRKYLPLTHHQLFLTSERKITYLPGKKVSLEELDSFIKEAIDDPKVVNSKVFLQKAFLFLSGQEDVLTEQQRCLYPYHAIEFDAKGVAHPCITGSKKNEGGDYSNLKNYILSNEYKERQQSLESCNKCRGSMMLCYYEPRLNFPLHHLISGFFKRNSRSIKN